VKIFQVIFWQSTIGTVSSEHKAMPIQTLKSNEPVEVKKDKMEWTRSETLALAQQSCTFCFGLGLRPGRAGTSTPCNCVFRAIFRACYEKFRLCVAKEKHVSRVSLEANLGQTRRSVWGLKNEEYTADFCLVSQRALSLREHRIFRFHYLLGADSVICCQKFGMDRGSFFHELYRIEQKLGRKFRELEPHALFPVDEYFNGTGRYEKSAIAVLSPYGVEDQSDEDEDGNIRPRSKKLLKFPIKKVA
jgi:hypothetical protein